MSKLLKFTSRNYGLTMLSLALTGFFLPQIYTIFHNYSDIFLMAALFLGCLKIQFSEILHLKNNKLKLVLYILISILIVPIVFHYTVNFINPDLKLGLFLLLATAGGVTAPMIANILNLKILWTTAYVVLSSLVIPFSIPFLIATFYHIHIDISYLDMSLFLLRMVLIPAILAIIFKNFLQKTSRKLISISNGIGPIIIGFFFAIVISRNQPFLLENLFHLNTIPILVGLIFVYSLKYLLGYLLPASDMKEKLSTSMMFGINNNGLMIILAADFLSSSVLLVLLLSQLPWILSQPLFEKFCKTKLSLKAK